MAEKKFIVEIAKSVYIQDLGGPGTRVTVPKGTAEALIRDRLAILIGVEVDGAPVTTNDLLDNSQAPVNRAAPPGVRKKS